MYVQLGLCPRGGGLVHNCAGILYSAASANPTAMNSSFA